MVTEWWCKHTLDYQFCVMVVKISDIHLKCIFGICLERSKLLKTVTFPSSFFSLSRTAQNIFYGVLTMSSVASLAAVTDSTRTRGTTVVNQDREEI